MKLGTRKIYNCLLWFVLLVFLLWLASFLCFAFSIYKEVADKETKTDAIVVLTGGFGRVSEAVRLLSEEKATILFISGVNKASNIERILPEGTDLGLYNNIVLGTRASNTFENARETAEFAHENNIKTIRLVTASYHMPRSILEIKIFMPDAEIIPNPVFSENFKHNEWWRWPGTFSLLLSEHAKYSFVLFRHFTYTLLGIKYQDFQSENGG